MSVVFHLFPAPLGLQKRPSSASMGRIYLAPKGPHGLSSMSILMPTTETERYLTQFFLGNRTPRYLLVGCFDCLLYAFANCMRSCFFADSSSVVSMLCMLWEDVLALDMLESACWLVGSMQLKLKLHCLSTLQLIFTYACTRVDL